MKFNEGKGCDAILRRLEEREGAFRSDLRWPEKEGHSAPVELVCKIGSLLFAVEHTGVEPFDNFMKLHNQAPEDFKPIENAVSAIVPANEIWELHVPALALQRLQRRRNIAAIQQELITWIKREALSLPSGPYADYRQPHRRAAAGTLPNVIFDVRLYRFETGPQSGGRMQIRHVVKDDLEASRERRIRRACDMKFPKLVWWKTNKGARTILLLEDTDISLTNHEIVAAQYLSIIAGRPDIPDETYLLSTFIDSFWTLFPLFIDGNSLFDLSGDGPPCHWEFHPQTLSSLPDR